MRRRALGASAADAVARAPRRSSRSTISTSSTIPSARRPRFGGDYGALVAAPRAAGRPDRRHLAYTAGEVESRLGVPQIAHDRLPPGRAAHGRARERAAGGAVHPVSRHARAAQEPRRCCSTPTTACVAAMPTRRRSCWPAAPSRSRSRGSRARAAAARRPRQACRATSPTKRAKASIEGAPCSCCRPSTKASACRCSRR